jgi:hypothetical protein
LPHNWSETVFSGDDAEQCAFIISKNIHRRHLTKQQQADLIVAAIKAGEASRQDGEMPKRHVKGKVGSEKDAVKAKAVETGKQHGISKRTVERSIAKAEGKKPRAKPKAKPIPKEVLDNRKAIDDQLKRMGARFVRAMVWGDEVVAMFPLPCHESEGVQEWNAACKAIGLKSALEPDHLAKPAAKPRITVMRNEPVDWGDDEEETEGNDTDDVIRHRGLLNGAATASNSLDWAEQHTNWLIENAPDKIGEEEVSAWEVVAKRAMDLSLRLKEVLERKAA